MKLRGPKGAVNTFAFLDDGATVTLVDETLANQLGLAGVEEVMDLKWYNNYAVQEPSRRVNLHIRGRSKGAVEHNINNARTVRKLELPTQTVNAAQLSDRYHHFNGLPIADYENAVPKILIGLDNSHLGLPRQIVPCDDDGFVAIRTQLGWVAYGKQSAQAGADDPAVVLHISALQDLHEIVRDYHDTESFRVRSSERPLVAKADARAERILQATTRRIKPDRYETGLLWANEDVNLPDSRGMAHQRLLGVERKMRMDAKYAAQYKETIAGYVRVAEMSA